MNRLSSLAAVAAVALAAIFSLASCGDSKADKLQNLQSAAEAVDSLLKPYAEAPSPVKAVDVTVAEPDIKVNVTFSDSLISVPALGDALLDYFVAQQLKSAPGDVVKQVVSALKENAGSVVVTITDGTASAAPCSYSAESISHLLKAKTSQLNAPRVKQQLCAAMSAGADNVQAAVQKSFLEYTVTWPSEKAYAGWRQGSLTRIYLTPFHDAFESLGVLNEPFVEMLKSLGIDGVKVTYAALNSDKTLSQAFPWRSVLSAPAEK